MHFISAFLKNIAKSFTRIIKSVRFYSLCESRCVIREMRCVYSAFRKLLHFRSMYCLKNDLRLKSLPTRSANISEMMERSWMKYSVVFSPSLFIQHTFNEFHFYHIQSHVRTDFSRANLQCVITKNHRGKISNKDRIVYRRLVKIFQLSDLSGHKNDARDWVITIAAFLKIFWIKRIRLSDSSSLV